MQTAREMLDNGWLPTLLDLEKWKDEDPARFGGFGWTALEVPGDCPRVAQRMAQLGVLFNEQYGRRMIASETLEAWQIRLQARFDCEVHVFERAYMLYEKYEEEMKEAIPGEDVQRKVESRDGGTDTVDSTNTAHTGNTGTQTNIANSTAKSADTPDTAINLSDSYADSVVKSESNNTRTDNLNTDSTGTGKQTTEYGRTGDVGENIRRRLSGVATDNVVRAIRGWYDLDCDFVQRFQNLFLNIFWY